MKIDGKHYKALSTLSAWQDNYNHGDVRAIARAIRQFGMNGALRVWRDGIVMAGNHTFLALKLIQEQGADTKQDRDWPPANVLVDDVDWYVRYVDVSHLDAIEVKAYAIADNALARKAVTDDQLLAEYLQQIAALKNDTMFRATGYDREGLYALLTVIGERSLNASAVDTKPDDATKDKLRQIDIIYTSGTLERGGEGAELTRWIQVHCCLAVKSGWLYGVRSSDGVCGTAERQEKHRPQFIDNHYHNYDHAQHLAALKRWHPKYATVRDIMTPEQCGAAGINYYPLEQILDWAEELSSHAENVMLIPKYDCIDKLPDKFMLGYSVPTSYGGTPLPVEMFKGHRVHLLGGSPKRQIQYFQALRDEVISLDNNYILKVARFGRVYVPDDASSRSLEDLGLGSLTNPLYAALALNFGLFAAYFGKQGESDAQLSLDAFDEDPEHEHAEAS